MTENEISKIVVDAVFKIHNNLGPGLLESIYEEILVFELDKQQLKYERQKELPVFYEGVKMNIGFRTDIIVEDKVILELKSVERILDVHKKQLLTYLKLSDFKLGLLINFNVNLIKDGIIRIVNNL